MKKNEVTVFQHKEIRRVWHHEEWWFSVEDIVLALTDSNDPKQYIKKMRKRDTELGNNWGTICTPLEMTAHDGKARKILASNTEGLLRIVQSIPSPKAEPLKLWLAKVGYERIQEIEDPELAMNRAKSFYVKKGYSKEWIDKRLRGIAVRQTLTGEWGERGIKNSIEYAILTNEIMTGTFEMKVQDYKELKGLEQENLRDHMDDMELILTMLAEATTTKLHRDRDSKGFTKIKKDANEGGKIAGETRKKIEKTSGKPISTKKNYLNKPEISDRIT